MNIRTFLLTRLGFKFTQAFIFESNELNSLIVGSIEHYFNNMSMETLYSENKYV